jgi:hypothetical protein
MFLFVPIRARIELHKLPALTILVVIACLAIYYFQSRNEARVVESALQYCANVTAGGGQFLGQQGDRSARAGQCAGRILKIHAHTRPREELERQTGTLRGKGQVLEAERLTEVYTRFSGTAPTFLTARLWFERPSWHVGRMLTSAFSHGSWAHVIFNLFFFFAFAATVEIPKKTRVREEWHLLKGTSQSIHCLCPTRHSRAGGNPVVFSGLLDSRLRGNDEKSGRLP